MAITVTDIVTEYGAYYHNDGQSESDLFQVAMQPLVTNEAFTLMITRDTVWRAAKSIMDSLVQAFQVPFTPKGGIEFKPIEIVQHHMKVDYQLSPDELMPTWLGFLASANVKRTEWPFIRWFLEKRFFPQIGADLELNEIGVGVATAPTANVAGPIKQSMNGVQTILNSHIAAGRTTPISMGAIPTSNVDFVKYVEDFADQLNKLYWRYDMTIYMGQDLERRYQRGHAELYGKETNTVIGKGGTKKVEFSNLSIMGLPSMNFKNNGAACNRIFCTPKENAVLMMNKANPFTDMDVQAFERVVKILMDWYMGVGFILPEIVFCNDQA